MTTTDFYTRYDVRLHFFLSIHNSPFAFIEKIKNGEQKKKRVQQSVSAREQNKMTLKFSICNAMEHKKNWTENCFKWLLNWNYAFKLMKAKKAQFSCMATNRWAWVTYDFLLSIWFELFKRRHPACEFYYTYMRFWQLALYYLKCYSMPTHLSMR